MPRMSEKLGVPTKPRQARPGTPPGRGGRPGFGAGQMPFTPTDEQRARVMTLTAAGLTNESISIAMYIPIATLERHFAWELSNGKTMMDAKILGGIVEMATLGDKTMSIFYARARGGWKQDGGAQAEAAAVFSININNGPSDAAPEISVIARPIHSLPEPEEEP